MERERLVGLIERDRRQVTRAATVAVYDAMLAYIAEESRRSRVDMAPKPSVDVTEVECPVCAARREANTKRQKRWRRKSRNPPTRTTPNPKS